MDCFARNDITADSCYVTLSEHGKLADVIIKQLPERFNISEINYVIMPNHLHMIIEIDDPWKRAAAEARVVGDADPYGHGETDNANRRGRPPGVPENEQTSETITHTISQIISTFKRFCNKDYGGNIWQRSFYDHVIRNEYDYLIY